MCWITREKPNVNIAKEDIKVFKVAKGCWTPYDFTITPWYRDLSGVVYGHMDFSGNIIPAKEDINTKKNFDIYEETLFNNKSVYKCFEAIHSYDEKLLDKSLEVSKGYSTFAVCGYRGVQCDWYDKNEGGFILHCVIPTGTRYAVNEYGEYVSDCIRVTSIKKL